MKINAIRILSLFSISFLSLGNSMGQDAGQPSAPAVTLGDQVTMKIGGFARADVMYDTRKNADALDGLLFLTPSSKSPDADGKDINDLSTIRMSGTASRMNAKFTGPDFLSAKTSSLIEFDFTGVNGIGLRLRHAWVKLNWQNSELLMGRFWHPMFILDAFPTVLALNTGAPFCVFNRAEQIRLTHKIGSSLSIMAAASAQMDYGFPGYEFSSKTGATTYQHNQVIPDLTVNAQFKTDEFIFGISTNYKVNQPLLSTSKGVDAAKKTYKTNEKVASISAEAYAMVKINKLKIKGSALYGENMHELLMMGGYAIKSKDTAATNSEKYSPVKNLSVWGNIIYGEQLQIGIFAGYSKNLGAADKDVFTMKDFTSYYGRGSNIDNLIRISPSIAYKVGKVQFWLELEHTIAAYGTNDATDYGKVKNTTKYANTRVQMASIFYF